MTEKYCKYCNQIKDISCFTKRTISPDGYQYKCTECKSKYQKGYYEEHKGHYQKYHQKYYGEHKECYQKYYQEHKNYYKGYYQNNKEKSKQKEDLGSNEKCRANSLKYYYANREKMKERAKERYYRIKHTPGFQLIKNRNRSKRLEAIKNSKNIATLEQINKLIEDSQNICFWCDCDIPKGEMHLDHIYPLSKGGEHSIYNMVVSCRMCNSAKSAKNPEVWLNEILNYV